MMDRRTLLQLGMAPFAPAWLRAQTGTVHDVVIYGGTAAAVTAAVQATRMGKSVVVVSPDRHLGGLSSGGLGFTDTGDKSVIGGLAREFYHRVWQHYQAADAWRWERREEFGNKGQGTPAIDGENRTMWIFEPHVAERVFEDLVSEYKITVVRDEWLDRAAGVTRAGPRIQSIRTLERPDLRGRMFIDATYEGDLMAAAGVALSRRSRVDATPTASRWNGVQTGVLHHRHHFGAVQRPDQPVRRSRRSCERGAATDFGRAARRLRDRRPQGAGVLLSHVPDRSRRESCAVRQAGPAMTRGSTNCSCESSMPAGARRSRSSIAFRTARPTRTITARSAPTTSG